MALNSNISILFFKPFTICRKNRILATHFLKGLCIFTSLLLLCTKHTSSFCAGIFYLLTTVFHTFLRIESKFFQFCSFAQMNGQIFVVIAKGFVEGVISDLFFPPLYSRWESDFYKRFSNFFQAFHYMQKKSGFVGAFFERFVQLYLTFVTMYKTYFEFLCKNSFALSTTLFHTFLRNCRNNLSALF